MYLGRLFMVLALTAAAARAQAPADVTVIDNGESAEASSKVWSAAGVTVEPSAEHATGGKGCLKLTFAATGGSLELALPSKSVDWSRYKSLRFDVYNPANHVVELGMRIDDQGAKGFRDRFQPCQQQYLPPRKLTHIEITLDDLAASISFRLMDTSKITHFGLHLGKADGPQVLYLDSVELIPLPAEGIAKIVPDAAEPKMIDDAESAEKSLALWSASKAKLEVATDNPIDGKASLRVTFPASEQWPGIKFESKSRSLDFRGYKSFQFDAVNPGKAPVVVGLRIDDANVRDRSGRFVVEDIKLPPGKTPVSVDIWRMASISGRRMDKGRISLIAIYTGPSTEPTVVYLDNVRLGVEEGKLRNVVRPGPIPGQTPETLGRALLKDPEIKPLLPIFKAMPPTRFAICSHSASITAHWSTSGGFFDIAAEALKAVNPNVEYRGFHQGGMGAGAALYKFLKPMQEYKPTDTYLLVVPSPLSAEQALIDGMKSVGSRVFVFDAVKPWGAFSPKTRNDVAKLCRDHGATFIELMPRGWGAPGSYKWTTSDTIHMVTEGHIFYAKELLKEWAKIYGPAL